MSHPLILGSHLSACLPALSHINNVFTDGYYMKRYWSQHGKRGPIFCGVSRLVRRILYPSESFPQIPQIISPFLSSLHHVLVTSLVYMTLFLNQETVVIESYHFAGFQNHLK